MELRHYWNIVRQRWPLVLGLPLVVAVLTAALFFVLPRQYAISTAMLITQRPLATAQSNVILPNQDNWNSWAASEYVVDDALQVVKTERFAKDIAEWIGREHQQQLGWEQIQQGIESDRKHRTVYLDITADSADHALWIAQGAVTMLSEKGLGYWKRDDTGTQIEVSVLDEPEKAAPAKGLIGLAVDLVIRTLLALILAVGLAFLLHYLDQRVRQPAEIEALGFELLAAIPAESKRKA